MSDDLTNEIEAIRAIYDDRTIRPHPDNNKTLYIFSIPPHHDVSIRLHFPHTYPTTDPPQIQGVESTGPNTRKGYGSHILGLADEVLHAVFEPRNVCLFDVVQELGARLSSSSSSGDTSRDDDEGSSGVAEPAAMPPTTTVRDAAPSSTAASSTGPSNFDCAAPPPPKWSTTPALTAKKSTFLARATTIHNPSQVHPSLTHLRATDKRTARATHVMFAYRIGGAGITYHEDYNDDGEVGAGAGLLHLLRRMGVCGVLVVVSRWYGGVKLGGERFRCINRVGREAVVRLREEEEGEGPMAA